MFLICGLAIAMVAYWNISAELDIKSLFLLMALRPLPVWKQLA
jgi:hypothetical protein